MLRASSTDARRRSAGDAVGSPAGRGGLVLVLVLVLVSVLHAAPLLAHSSLETATPSLDARVEEVPTVQLRFGEPLLEDERNFIWIIDAADNTFDLGDTRLADRNYVLEADVPTPLPIGEYFVRYRAVSSDGDGLQEGGYSFSVVAPPGSGGTIALLAIGIVGMTIVVVLLRPRRSGRTRSP